MDLTCFQLKFCWAVFASSSSQSIVWDSDSAARARWICCWKTWRGRRLQTLRVRSNALYRVATTCVIVHEDAISAKTGYVWLCKLRIRRVCCISRVSYNWSAATVNHVIWIKQRTQWPSTSGEAAASPCRFGRFGRKGHDALNTSLGGFVAVSAVMMDAQTNFWWWCVPSCRIRLTVQLVRLVKGDVSLGAVMWVCKKRTRKRWNA